MTDAGASLELDSIVREASERAGGASDFGPGPFIDPLQLAVDSLESDGRLNAIGRMIARERMVGHTTNRLNYVNDRKRFPGIADERIVKPVFIIGMPRTGTTILHAHPGAGPLQPGPAHLGGHVPFAPARGGDLPNRSPHRGVCGHLSRRWNCRSPPSRRCIRWGPSSLRSASP